MFFDFSSLSGHDRHKLLISTVVPRPIAWITSRNGDGGVNAAPFSFFNVMCGDPPILAIGIGDGERAHIAGDAKDTGVNIRRERNFVVNLVDRAHMQAMVTSAVNFPPGVSEVERAGLALAASSHIATPRIATAAASFECRLFEIVELPGRQMIVLGEALALHVADAAVADAARHYLAPERLGLVGRMHGEGWYAELGAMFQQRTPRDLA